MCEEEYNRHDIHVQQPYISQENLSLMFCPELLD